ncbi:MAG: ankyrin repeat domain-containing protein [Variovorax sp.]
MIIKHLKLVVYLILALQVFASHADPFDDFFRAIKREDAGEIRDLLKRGFDPNARDPSGQPVLILAIREPSPKVVDALLASPRTDVNILNPKDESPLMMAAIKGQKDVVLRLLQRDAAVNKPGWTPLHYAASSGQVEIMKILLDRYAFIDAESPNGSTPLMMAAMYGSTDSVKLLLAEGADTAMRNVLGLSAFDFAKRGARPDAIALLDNLAQDRRPASGAVVAPAKPTPVPAQAPVQTSTQTAAQTSTHTATQTAAQTSTQAAAQPEPPQAPSTAPAPAVVDAPVYTPADMAPAPTRPPPQRKPPPPLIYLGDGKL